MRGQNANIGAGVFIGGTGQLINQGAISVDMTGGVFNLAPSSAAADSVSNAGLLEAKNGGLLNLNSNITNTGTGSIHVATGGSRVNQNGVRITGGTINIDAGGLFIPANNGNNFLDHVTVNGTIDLTAVGVERVVNTLTLNGTVTLNNNSVLAFQGDQSLLGNATVVFGETTNNRLSIDGNSTLTLPATAVLRGKNANIGPGVFVGGTGKLANEGLISADVAAGTFNLAPNSTALDSVKNTGTLEARNSAILNLNSNVTNTGGVIRADAGRVNQNGIQITGGTINVLNGGNFAPSNNGNNILSGVTVNGDINMTSTAQERIVTNPLTLNGTANIDGSSILAFQGDQSLLGNATLLFGAAANNRLAIDGNTTLTLPSTATIRGRNANIGPAVNLGGTGKIINQGLISADVATGVITLAPSSTAADSITNAGTVEAKNGGILTISSNVTNTPTGIIHAAPAGSRVNQNAVRITGGAINIEAGGSFAPSNNGANFLDAVTVTGIIDMNAVGQERVVNGLTLNGGAQINNSSVIGFQGNQTLTGPATLVFGGTGSNRLSIDGDTTLTLAPDVVLRGQNATLGTPVYAAGTVRLLNRGLISVDVAAGVFNLAPTNAALDATNNFGTLEAKNGGTLNLNNHVTNSGAGQIHVATGSRVNQNGVRVTGGAINVDAGGAFVPSNSGANLLAGVTVNGDINMNAVGQERVLSNLTLNGTAHINNSSVIGFEGDQTLLGNATFVFGAVGNNRLSIDGNTTLTLAPTVVLRGQDATIGTPVFLGGTVRLSNQGLISADVDTGVFNVAPTNAAFDAVSNSGTLEAKNGGTLNLNSHVTNTGSGQIHVAGASRVNHNGVRITGGVINVDATGSFSPANNGNNHLSGVTVNGDINMLALSQERIINGMTLNGTVHMNNNSILGFEGNQTLGGNGTLAFGATSNNRLSIDGNSTLTLGPNIVLRGQHANIGPAVYLGGTGGLVNNGRISADVTGGTLLVSPSGALRNNATGTMEARNGATLTLDPGNVANAFVGQGALRATAGGTLILTGSGGGTFDNTAGSFQIDAGSTASFVSNINFSSGNVTNNGVITMANGTVNLGQLAGTGSTTVSAGILTADHIRQDDLTIGASARVNIRPNGTATGTSVIQPNTLTIAGVTNAWTGKLDLTNNDMVGRSTSAGKLADLARINNQLKVGLAEASGNFWTGNGISSSTAASTAGGTLTAVGAILNDFAQAGLPPGPIYTDFSGVTVGATDILMKYTYFGDADLSGVVDGTDYFLIDQAFSSGLLNGGWLNGDFSYDGKVDGTDYFLIDNAFGAQTGALGLSASAVPEPSIVALLAMAGGLLAQRRRR